MGLREMSLVDLLRLYGNVETKFLRRKIMRKQGGVVGGYTEELVRSGLGLVDEGHNTKDIDAKDPRNCEKYQIKGRRGGNVMLGGISSLVPRKFDFLVGVIFNKDFTVRRAAKIPYSVVVETAKLNSRNEYNVTLTNKLLSRDDVEDIKDKLRLPLSPHFPYG